MVPREDSLFPLPDEKASVEMAVVPSNASQAHNRHVNRQGQN